MVKSKDNLDKLIDSKLPSDIPKTSTDRIVEAAIKDIIDKARKRIDKKKTN